MDSNDARSKKVIVYKNNYGLKEKVEFISINNKIQTEGNYVYEFEKNTKLPLGHGKHSIYKNGNSYRGKTLIYGFSRSYLYSLEDGRIISNIIPLFDINSLDQEVFLDPSNYYNSFANIYFELDSIFTGTIQQFDYVRNASSKDLDALSLLGKYYYFGDGTKKDTIKGLEILYAAAEKGASEAQYFLGSILTEQYPDKFKDGFDYYRLAYKSGHKNATWNLGLISLGGTCFSSPDLELAVECFQSLDENADAKRILGKIYLSKQYSNAGFKPDLFKAKKYLVDESNNVAEWNEFENLFKLRHRMLAFFRYFPELFPLLNLDVNFENENNVYNLIKELEQYNNIFSDAVIQKMKINLLDEIGILYKSNPEYELACFEKIKSNNSLDKFRSYVNRFPNSPHSIQAQKKIDQFDLDAYQRSTKSNDENSYNIYIENFPKGKYVNEAKNKINIIKQKQQLAKQSEIQKQQDRQTKISSNSNISVWNLGDRICSKDNQNGTIEAVLDQWNENKTKVKAKIIGGPSGNYNGEDITKGNYIWVDVKNWYKCIGDEKIDHNLKSSSTSSNSVSKAIENDNNECGVTHEMIGKYAKGIAKQIMYRGAVGEITSGVNCDIKNWVSGGTKNECLIMIEVSITWFENYLKNSQKQVDGVLICDFYGCNAGMMISARNVSSLIFGDKFSNAGNATENMKETIEDVMGVKINKVAAVDDCVGD